MSPSRTVRETCVCLRRFRFGQVGTMRAGLVTRIVAYPDWESAALAVGLRLDDLARG
jgi:hypothetical protein